MWPQLDDERLLIRHLLTHTAGRVTVPDVSLIDWDRSVAALAAMAPDWPPGEVVCEHALTFGHLGGEVVRRVDGRSLGRLMADELAGPLGGLWAPARLEPGPGWSVRAIGHALFADAEKGVAPTPEVAVSRKRSHPAQPRAGASTGRASLESRRPTPASEVADRVSGLACDPAVAPDRSHRAGGATRPLSVTDMWVMVV